MSECLGLTVRYDQGLRGGFREVNGHCPGCTAHGGDRLTPEERADFEAWRAFIHRFADMGDHQDLRMCAIIDRLAPKPGGAP